MSSSHTGNTKGQREASHRLLTFKNQARCADDDCINNFSTESDNRNQHDGSERADDSFLPANPPIAIAVAILPEQKLATVTIEENVMLRTSKSPTTKNQTVMTRVETPPTVETPFTVALLGSSEPVSDFPIVIPYSRVSAPTKLPFDVRGSFRADPSTPDYSGLVYHQQHCETHSTCEGFKITIRPDGTIGCQVSQYTSYYRSAFSQQDNLKDGLWHSFVCTVTQEAISVQVDGIRSLLVGTSDERGTQNPKLFGRVVHDGPFIIGDNPCCSTNRRFVGELKDLVIIDPTIATATTAGELKDSAITDPTVVTTTTTLVDLLGNSEPVSDFPIVIPYSRVSAPAKLPFDVRGSFRADPATPDYSGLVNHQQHCETHSTCEGFKIYIHPDGKIGCQVSQYTSYYRSAFSEQDNLKDGLWHSFVCTVTQEAISVQVDGIRSLLVGTSDERGTQNPKLFGRVVHDGPFIIGDDPGSSTNRRFVGELKDLVITDPTIATTTTTLHIQQPPTGTYTTERLGPKDFINVGTHEELGLIGKSFTFETWVNVDELAVFGAPYADNNIFSSEYGGEDGTVGLLLRHIPDDEEEPPGISWSFWNRGNHIQMPVVIPLNTWFHVSASYDIVKRELRLLYYSPGSHGESPTTLTETRQNVPPLKGGATLLQMGNPDLERKALNGALAEFRLWNYARTVDETTKQRSTIVLPTNDGRLTYRYDSSTN